MGDIFEGRAVLVGHPRRLAPSPHESIIPALGLSLVGCASVSMWFGVALLLRWAAGTVF